MCFCSSLFVSCLCLSAQPVAPPAHLCVSPPLIWTTQLPALFSLSNIPAFVVNNYLWTVVLPPASAFCINKKLHPNTQLHMEIFAQWQSENDLRKPFVPFLWIKLLNPTLLSTSSAGDQSLYKTLYCVIHRMSIFLSRMPSSAWKNFFFF